MYPPSAQLTPPPSYFAYLPLQEKGYTALMWAAARGHTDALKLLLADRDINVHQVNVSLHLLTLPQLLNLGGCEGHLPPSILTPPPPSPFLPPLHPTPPLLFQLYPPHALFFPMYYMFASLCSTAERRQKSVPLSCLPG